MLRVPVLSGQGLTLMPTKASRARRWLKAGIAKVVHNDLGIFQIQLTKYALDETQLLVDSNNASLGAVGMIAHKWGYSVDKNNLTPTGNKKGAVFGVSNYHIDNGGLVSW